MKTIILDFSKPISNIEITEDTNIFGLFLSKDQNSSKSFPVLEFKNNNVSVNLNVKAVLTEKSDFEFSPILKVGPNNKGTTANIKINILNLSNESISISTPSMEIQQPDISATHSLAISTLNETQLTYLKSRGLTETQSKEILIQSFISDIIKEIN